MGRLVEPRPASGRLLAGAPADDYATRVAKYIPAEFVAAYLAVDKIIKPDQDWSKLTAAFQHEALVQGGFAFLALMLLNGIYLWWRGRRERKQYKLHLGISSIAFIFWAFALPGTLFMPVYSPKWSAMLLIIFSAAAGVFEPDAPSDTSAAAAGTQAPRT